MVDWKRVANKLSYGLAYNKIPAPYRSRSNFGSGYGMGGDPMQSAGTMYSILRLNSQSVAQVDWHLYRKQVDGRRVYGPTEDNRREVTQHLALRVLNQPNPIMHRQLFFERSQLLLDIHGEVFWVVVRVGSTPLEIWPYAPNSITPTIDSGGNVASWVYKRNTPDEKTFKAADVIQIQTPDPADMYRGSGPSRTLSTEIDSFRLAGKYNQNYFRNSAQPGGFYKFDHVMQEPEFNDFVERQREMHQGVANAGRVGILENAEWIESSTTHKDMQFQELRDQSRELMRETYGIHKHMLGLSDDVNRANATAAGIDYGRWQLTPRLERFKAALNLVFLPMFGETGNNVEFCYDNPIPDDPEQENADRDSKVKAAVLLIREGFDPEETLAAFGLPEIPFIGKAADTNEPDPTETADPEQSLEAVA